MDESVWQRALDVNVTSHYRCARAFTETMVAHQYGRIIINIGSITARWPPQSGRIGCGLGGAAWSDSIVGSRTRSVRHLRQHRRARPDRS
ncbi:SDR family NAD(P)-dependent oxidoreductase [Nonomuraea sp. NBC_00507]|uniref:SDR family NAD(P)-dependent oxidoreductase n=1 Tax=Nonomuraea sp. NBC_00507 TaxID=2976002 RepID=UPI003FA5B041